MICMESKYSYIISEARSGAAAEELGRNAVTRAAPGRSSGVELPATAPNTRYHQTLDRLATRHNCRTDKTVRMPAGLVQRRSHSKLLQLYFVFNLVGVV